jgi:hypothetical protein
VQRGQAGKAGRQALRLSGEHQVSKACRITCAEQRAPILLHVVALPTHSRQGLLASADAQYTSPAQAWVIGYVHADVPWVCAVLKRSRVAAYHAFMHALLAGWLHDQLAGGWLVIIVTFGRMHAMYLS